VFDAENAGLFGYYGIRTSLIIAIMVALIPLFITAIFQIDGWLARRRLIVPGARPRSRLQR
jgi:hypothetical protein